MSIALDIGAHRMRSLRRERGSSTSNVGALHRRALQGRALQGRSCRSVYAALDDDAALRSLIDSIGLPYSVCEDSLILVGDEANTFSRQMRVPAIELLPAGRIPRKDPPARQILGALIPALLPPPVATQQVCCLTVPGVSADGRAGANYEYEFLSRLVRMHGYQPLALHASQALILAELVDELFTGIGIVFGASTCQMSLAHNGTEIAHAAIPVGGNWIDSEIAERECRYSWDVHGNRYLDTASVTHWKESLTVSILGPRDKQEQFLAELYNELVSHIFEEVGRRFSPVCASRALREPIPVVVGGAAARIPAFDQLIEKVQRGKTSRLVTKPVRVADDPEYSIVRGCLIQAELETAALQTVAHPAA